MFGRKSNSRLRQRSQKRQRRHLLALESLESRNLLSGSPWQNPLACNDLDDDGTVTAGDALVAINAINATSSGNLSERMAAPTLASGAKKYLDADGDSSLSASDVISVINAVNGGRASASTEADELPTTDEQPDEIGTDVPELTLTNGFARVRSALNVAGDVDVYRVTAATTDLNVALFSRESGLTVSLVDEAGEVVATAEAATGPRQPAVLNATLEVGATYFIVVSGGEDITGGYCLQAIDTDSAPPPPRRLPPAELFAKIDADASGSLSLEEFSTLKPPQNAAETPDTVFTKLDADADGSLSLTEFLALAPPKPTEDSTESNSEKPPKGDRKPPRGAPPAPAAVFAHLDADTDDSLSSEEFAAFRLPPGVTTAIDELFAAWDTDSSSLLSLSEFEAGLAGLKKR